MQEIRKISVGSNYPDKAMHFQVGQIRTLQGVDYTISILRRNEELYQQGKLAYDVYLENEHGTILWKTLVDMPTVIENNINFE